MKSPEKPPDTRFSGTVGKRKLQLGIPFAMLASILCAGVVGFEVSRDGGSGPFDPRMKKVPSTVIHPLDPAYRGYIPDDAVIPARDGFYVPDPPGRFRKIPAKGP